MLVVLPKKANSPAKARSGNDRVRVECASTRSLTAHHVLPSACTGALSTRPTSSAHRSTERSKKKKKNLCCVLPRRSRHVEPVEYSSVSHDREHNRRTSRRVGGGGATPSQSNLFERVGVRRVASQKRSMREGTVQPARTRFRFEVDFRLKYGVLR